MQNAPSKTPRTNGKYGNGKGAGVRGAAKGLSLHIGLNHVDPTKYKDEDGESWDGALRGCINDARDMQAIAVAQGFRTTLFTDDQATSGEVIKTVGRLATELSSGDIFLLTYSGHGGQVPDVNGEEEDGQDETWCLFDRMLLDDELYNLWTHFAAGVRIYVLSDSCHSGTVLKQMVYTHVPDVGTLSTYVTNQSSRAPKLTEYQALELMREAKPRKYRNLPKDVERATYRADKKTYDAVQWAAGRSGRAMVGAHVLLLSGCQDNQLSADGDGNGLFTQTLLDTWDGGKFSGDYRAFATSIINKMPGTQTPNYYTAGPESTSFETEKPFTIGAVSDSGMSNPVPEPDSARPSITAESDSIDRAGAPPRFRVATGDHDYFIVEIAADTGVFADRPDANTAEFYATYYDAEAPRRETGRSFTLADHAWQQMKGNDRLYYRIGTTGSDSSWDDYILSTEDDAQPPSFEIAAEGGMVEPEPSSDAPSITAESQSLGRDGDAPRFQVAAGAHEYFVVEVAASRNSFLDRPDGNTAQFYATYYDEDRPNRETGRSFTLPEYAWQALKVADRLYYRIGTTSSDSTWDDYTLSTEDDGEAPSLAITGTDGRVPPKGGVKVPKSKSTARSGYGAPPAGVGAPPPSPWTHGSETPTEAIRMAKEQRTKDRPSTTYPPGTPTYS
jgi:hypothetical protein